MNHSLSAINVGNFKAFADTQHIPLKPITLIFGPNSSGKSSIIHSLAFAHDAQLGQEKLDFSRLDIHHTDIGGRSIDLGGFRQYIHQRIYDKKMEWGAELAVDMLGGNIAALLSSLKTVSISISIGINADSGDLKVGDEPRVESIDINGDGVELLHMSRRSSLSDYSKDNVFRIDRLKTEHQVFQQIINAIVETATTTESISLEDIDVLCESIDNLLPDLLVGVEKFFPTSVVIQKEDDSEPLQNDMLFPVSKGNRKEDLSKVVHAYFPRILNDLLNGISNTLTNELSRFQYLGPLRSFPPRHLSFSEHGDVNWNAGGGFAWDVIRNDIQVRNAVNKWLGSDKLKTPYLLTIKSFFSLDALDVPLENGLGFIQYLKEQKNSEMELENKSEKFFDDISLDDFEDIEFKKQTLIEEIDRSDIDRIRELVLFDKRTKTEVSHRDVGIGISQVLPVLVMAYGSKGKIIAMEQPEIHLHPALQTELGDVFIESALGEYNNTFILETHSEHLILRLLRRIRETSEGELPEGYTSVRPEDVCVIYVQPEKEGSKAIEIKLTPDGDFATPWPDGFFAERAKELFG